MVESGDTDRQEKKKKIPRGSLVMHEQEINNRIIQ